MGGGIIHAGAWDGREYAHTPPPLLLFEPQTGPFRRLQENCPHALLVNAACGAKAGKATMHVHRLDHSSSLLAPAHGDFIGTTTVKVTTVDARVKGDLRGQFSVLAIDTQGYELEVLKGATRTLKNLSKVEIELHDPGTYPGAASIEDLDAFLLPLGFERTVTTMPGRDDLGDLIYER